MANPTSNQSWKFLLDQLQDKFKEIDRLKERSLGTSEKVQLFNLLKGEIDLMVDDFVRLSNKISLEGEINIEVRTVNLSEDRINYIKSIIYSLNEFFAVYLSAVQDIKNHNPELWYGDLFHKNYHFFAQDDIFKPFDFYLWSNLPVISEINYITAPLVDRFISSSTQSVPGGINYSVNNMWEIDFGTLNQFILKFEGDNIRLQNCVALYIVHEAFHKKMHNLDRYTVERIGDFSRVIEEADYQADVYAIINVLLFRLKTKDNRLINSLALDIAIDLVNTAIDTTFSFAQLEAKPPFRLSQIRRVNRTLIWIYQLLRLEELKKFSEQNQLAGIYTILSRKPIIDISGLEIIAHNNRVFFKLNLSNADQIEIATFKDNSIYRNDSNRDRFKNLLIEGFQHLDKEKLKEALTAYLRKARILT
jgi:hypothetical protein